MGVLACNRLVCTSIMCDFYSETHGYLCYSCKRELVEKGPVDIYQFMGSSPIGPEDWNEWEDIVDGVFGER